MLWIYGLTCFDRLHQIQYMNVSTCTLSLKIVVDAFLVHFEIFCTYQILWDRLVVMVAYSFRSLVLKSLMVEMHKHVYQKQMIKLDVEVQNCCVNCLKNLKACGVLYCTTCWWYPQYVKICWMVMSTNRQKYNPIMSF